MEFERPLVGAGRTLFLKAVAPLVVGRRHRVPTLRAPDLFWQQATLTLSVPAPLEIVRLDPRESVFTNPVPLAGNRPGEAVEVQCFAPSASVDLLLGPPQSAGRCFDRHALERARRGSGRDVSR